MQEALNPGEKSMGVRIWKWCGVGVPMLSEMVGPGAYEGAADKCS